MSIKNITIGLVSLVKIYTSNLKNQFSWANLSLGKCELR